MKSAHVFPSCRKACKQGRQLCTSPELCQLSLDEDLPLDCATGIIVWVGVSLAAWAAIVAVWVVL